MSWLENVDVTAGTAVFGVETEVGIQYMKLRREGNEAYAVVDVDAQQFRKRSINHTLPPRA